MSNPTPKQRRAALQEAIADARPRPSHRLCLMTEDGERTNFTEVAVLWTTKAGTGFTGTIPQGLTLSGRIGVFAIDQPDGGQQ